MNYYLRKKYILIFVISLIMLSACGENESSNENTEQETTETQATPKPSDDEADEKEKEQTNETKGSPSGVEGVLKKAAEAMGQVSGMTLTGETQTTTDLSGISTEETGKITGEMTFDPMTQHLNSQSESNSDGIPDIPGLEKEGTTEMEMYMTEEGVYMTDSDMGQWLLMPLEQGGPLANMSAAITDTQLDYFAKIHDSFKLSESDGHYILTFTGSGDTFKEVSFGMMKELGGEELYEDLTGMISDISGTYEITISKDTFYIVEMATDIDQTMDMGVGKIHSLEKSHYKYSDFNEVNPVSVPDDVLENAQSMTDLQEGN